MEAAKGAPDELPVVTRNLFILATLLIAVPERRSEADVFQESATSGAKFASAKKNAPFHLLDSHVAAIEILRQKVTP